MSLFFGLVLQTDRIKSTGSVEMVVRMTLSDLLCSVSAELDGSPGIAVDGLPRFLPPVKI